MINEIKFNINVVFVIINNKSLFINKLIDELKFNCINKLISERISFDNKLHSKN